MTALRREGVDILVSLLTHEEELELGLIHERSACADAQIEFRQFSIPDRQTPLDRKAFRQFMEGLYQEILKGRSIAAHCRAGIGRSSLLLASLLSFQGYPAEESFTMISKARGLQVPDTPEQVDWVRQFNPSS